MQVTMPNPGWMCPKCTHYNKLSSDACVGCLEREAKQMREQRDQLLFALNMLLPELPHINGNDVVRALALKAIAKAEKGGV